MTLFSAPDVPARRVSLVKLSAEIARSLATVGRIAVEGEVHKPTRRPGGRIYFTLRDRAAQINVTVPAGRARQARVAHGERVLVTAKLEWVNQWGALQLAAEEVTPVGEGAIAAAIAEARERLRADGLLDRRRRSIPVLPRAIGVVCGSEAAVRHDIEIVIEGRFPGYPVLFREVTVSGPGAADAIAGGLRDLAQHPDVEVVILARGGGDPVQLLPFSDEELCRAICEVDVAVVSAIGHENDRPLCDEVADLRCGTPSLAAHAVVPDHAALSAQLAAVWDRAAVTLARAQEHAERRLAAVDRDRAVRTGVDRAAARLDRAGGRLALVHPGRLLGPATAAVEGHRRQLDALNPRRVLERGYAVVRTVDGDVVRDARSLAVGDGLHIDVAAGRVAARVEEVTR